MVKNDFNPSSRELAALLSEIRELMTLKGENPFKVRAFEKAADLIEGMGEGEDWGARTRAGTLTDLPGIGKGISEVITEYVNSRGDSKTRDEIRASLPEGLVELTQVPGLGPKKAMLLIEELGIKSVAELEYACQENRLLKLKGFGEKAQAKILEGAQFLRQNSGQQRLVDAFPVAETLVKKLAEIANEDRHPAGGALRVVETGALRRRTETLSRLDFLVEAPLGEKSKAEIEKRVRSALVAYAVDHPLPLPVELHFASTSEFGSEWARTTATEEHWKALQPAGAAVSGAPDGARLSAGSVPADPDEEHLYRTLASAWIPPEMRETGEEVAAARAGKLAGVLPWDGVRGVFHIHTTRSDGVATLEQMVVAAKKRGYAYIGVSDHSKSAFYAQGLNEDALADQEREIREVQAKHPDIRIFWGIESDILADGSLDYDDKQLKKFDFVIASVHSRFQMEIEGMTDRILTAIRNPATRFLGHLTGRLLLGRKGYPLHMERVLREAAKYDVAIEINAHPARLDIDWRYGPMLREFGTKVSVNPDAHEIDGLDDVKYGVLVARKALLPTELVVNAGSVDEVEAWLRRK